MHVAIVCYPSQGGSGVVASELALRLAERGHVAHVVSYSVPFRLREFNPRVHVHQVEVATYPLFKYPPYTLGLATKLAELAAEQSLDIIHAHYAVPHAVGAYLARQILGDSAPQIVTTLHGTDITLVGADDSFHRVTKFAIEVSDAVTAVSQFLRRRTIDEFSLERDVEVIYNFVDTAQNPPHPRFGRENWAPNGERILIHASNFRPVKRPSDVVRVFERVRRAVPSKLLLVGEGPERLFVRQLARELGLAEHVHFLGEQDRLEDLLSCADLFLLPSEQESFGLAALEAMSCRVPVVATDVGGLPEVVLDGETGYLVPVGEVRAMAEATLELLSDPDKHARFADAGRARARAEFDINKIVPQYEALYEKLL